MNEDIIKSTCQSLNLPLYALIHDSITQALKAARVSRQVALAIIEHIPKLSISANEQNELDKAQGVIQLEDSFGSGDFYVIDAGSQKALVCTEQKNVDYLDQLMKSRSDQDFLPQDPLSENQQTTQNQNQIQNQMQNQNLNQAQNNQTQPIQPQQNQSQQNQTLDPDFLTNLQVINWILKSNDQNQKQNQKQTPIKIGQMKQQKDQNLIQKIALLEILQGKSTTDLLKNIQMMHMIEELSQSGNIQLNSIQ